MGQFLDSVCISSKRPQQRFIQSLLEHFSDRGPLHLVPLVLVARRRRWHPTFQSSCLESPMDGGAWWAAVHGVAKSWTRLSDFTFTFHFHALEKEMATHSSVLAWRIPGMGEPGGLPSVGSHRVGHNWSDLAAAVLVAQLCLTLSDHVDCSPQASSVHGTLQARILEWVAISLSKRSSKPRDQTQVSCIAGFFIIWATRELVGKKNCFLT